MRLLDSQCIKYTSYMLILPAITTVPLGKLGSILKRKVNGASAALKFAAAVGRAPIGQVFLIHRCHDMRALGYRRKQREDAEDAIFAKQNA